MRVEAFLKGSQTSGVHYIGKAAGIVNGGIPQSHAINRTPMRRAILSLASGLLCSGLMVSYFAAFVVHDVDKGRGYTDGFIGLCIESIFFVLVVGVPAWLLTLLGQYFLGIRDFPPRANFSFWLGVALPLFQYPFEFSARLLAPRLANTFLWI